MAVNKTIKYLLFFFNFLFWVSRSLRVDPSWCFKPAVWFFCISAPQCSSCGSDGSVREGKYRIASRMGNKQNMFTESRLEMVLLLLSGTKKVEFSDLVKSSMACYRYMLA